VNNLNSVSIQKFNTNSAIHCK